MLMFVSIKKAILNLRLKEEVRDEFAIAADLRGASMSGLLHQFIVKTIREEKELAPQAFKKEQPQATIREMQTQTIPITESVGQADFKVKKGKQ